MVRSRPIALGRAVLGAILLAASAYAAAPAGAGAATGFGQLSGADGCLTAIGHKSESDAAAHCGAGKALVGPSAVAVSPDGNNLYVASGTSGATVALSFGSLVILKRDPATGSITEVGCLSSDGTDGRDGASGACTPTPSLLGADGVTVSPDGLTVFVTANMSASVVAFKRDPATGSLTRLGCFQYHPSPGSGCTPANVFPGSAAVTSSADGRALYVASPTLGSISTLTGALVTPATPTAGAPSPAEASVAAIFGVPEPGYLANPCVAVNGYDGTCGVGVATAGLNSLALGPGGEQLYALAPGSGAVDVFAHGATGTLTESSCLKVNPPPGLCTASSRLQSPTQLAISPDGKNVYVADSFESRGRVDVLSRDPATGALSDSGCVQEVPPPPEKHEKGEEEEEETHEAAPAPDGCTDVPGLQSVESIAVTGDGSMVYALGSASAVVFARDPASGKLNEVSCSAEEDSSCVAYPSPGSIDGAAVSPDGRFLYATAPTENTVYAFGVGLTVATASTSATPAGIARVRVECPRSMRRACAGRLELTRAVRGRAARGRHPRRLRRLAAGRSGRFTIRPGARATVAVRLSPASRRLLLARRRLRLLAVVHTQPLAGGGGYGRVVKLRLGG